MADIDRQTYAYACLKDASRTYDELVPGARSRYPELAAQIAIGHYLKLLVDANVKFGPDGNVTRPE